jgi:glycosyltransferase involved in cell wall biosynthesis
VSPRECLKYTTSRRIILELLEKFSICADNSEMPSLELSMIVKNGASTLGRCLESVRSVVDEIVIVDTGSTDASVSIGRQFGARVVEVPWADDFSKARNAALREGHCDWVLFLDADEMLDKESAKTIAPLLTQSDVMGYDVRIWNYVLALTDRVLSRPATLNPHLLSAARMFPGYVEHVNVRLFLRHCDIVFEGRVHEGVADRMKRLGLRVLPAQFVVHHLGIAEEKAEERSRKMEYYRQLGRRKLSDSPNDARAYYELGLGELEHFHDPRAALPYFIRAIELKPHSSVLWTCLGCCLVRLGRFCEAVEALGVAEKCGARDVSYLEALGDAQYHLEKFGEAEKNYEAAKVAGSRSSVLECKLGVCEVRLGNARTGLGRICEAIGRAPAFGELYDIGIAAALFAQDERLAAEIAERRLGIGVPSAESFLLTAGIHAKLGKWQRSAEIIQAGSERFPGDASLHSALAEVNEKLRAVS